MTYKETLRSLEDRLTCLKKYPREQCGAFAHYIMETTECAIEAVEKMIPKKPEMKAMPGFDPEVASSLCCPTCNGSVTNYWVRGAKPKHCQFCGQAIDWTEEAKT